MTTSEGRDATRRRRDSAPHSNLRNLRLVCKVYIQLVTGLVSSIIVATPSANHQMKRAFRNAYAWLMAAFFFCQSKSMAESDSPYSCRKRER